MTLALFKYCLPALLGYILFVGVSGRLDPVSRPRRLIERPSWALGLWIGVAVALTLTVLLHLAYEAPLAEARGLLAPSAWLLAALLLPGLVAWLLYRASIGRLVDEEMRLRRHRSAREALLPELPPSLPAAPASGLSPERFGGADGPRDGAPDAAVVELDDGSATETPAGGVPVPAPVAALETASETASEIAFETASETAPAALSVAAPTTVPEVPAGTRPDPAADELDTLQRALRTERDLREEIERHLRITRRALGVLESESRHREGEKADVLIALEEELESRIRETSTAEAHATREAARRAEAETTIVALKQDVLAARREARRGTDARAKALAAATRSIALARQAVQARELAERRLQDGEERTRELEASLANRQTTISSLIRALEKEKRRTQDEVASMARQLVLHERQLHARRTLEEVARSVEGKLSTRLARKVARARPLASGN